MGLLIAAAIIVVALIGLVFLRPFRLEYPPIYSLLLGVTMLATAGYMISYAFIKKK